MAMKFQSLGEVLQDLPAADADVVVLARTPDGFKDLKVSTLQVFMNAALITRIENLEDNPLTSTWPVARKLSLAGPFVGEVMLDGRQDEVMTVTVPTGALPTSAISGLPTLLLGLNTTADDHEARLDSVESTLPNKLDVTANAATASRWQTARLFTLSGKAVGIATVDGSADVNINVTSLSVNKADVGLGNVDNTSDANKPVSTATQTALNAKVTAAADNQAVVDLPTQYQDNAVSTGGILSGHPGPGGIGPHITGRSNSDNRVMQLLASNGGGTDVPDLWFRTHHSTNGGGGWTATQKLWHGGNFDPATKADLAGAPVFDGNVTSKGGSLFVNAASAAVNAHLWLRNETGVNQGVLYWDRTSDTIRLRRYDSNGTGIEGELVLDAANLSWNGYNVWTSQTFDPATKLGVSATAAAATKLATSRNFSMTGVVTAAAVGFDGSGNVVLASSIADNALLIAKTSGLQAALDGKASTSHNHDGVYATAAHNHDSVYAAVAHNHTGVYAPATHNHDTAYVKIPNATGYVDPNTLGATLSHGIIGDVLGNGPSVYSTVWNLGATGNRDGQFGWYFGSGNPSLYFRSRHDTTGNWNSWVRMWHSGDFSVDEANVASTVAKRTASGDIHARLFRSEFGDNATFSGGMAFRVNNTTDNYIRFCNVPSAVRGWLGLGTASLSATTDFVANRPSLYTVANTITDWNNATDNGWHMASGAANAPTAGGSWYIAIVTQHNPNWISQEAWDFTAGAGAYRYRRAKLNGTWSAWTTDINVGNIGAAAITATGVISAPRIAAGYDAGIANSISCSSWFRSSGSTGWYNSDYAGGWHMSDTTYVRSYTNKAVAAGDFVISSDQRLKTYIRPFEFKGRLRPVNYLHKQSMLPDFGFIAQEVQALYPEAVSSGAGDDNLLKLSYPKLTAVLSHQVNCLEDERDKMRVELDLLRSQMDQLLNPWWKRLLKRLFRRT